MKELFNRYVYARVMFKNDRVALLRLGPLLYLSMDSYLAGDEPIIVSYELRLFNHRVYRGTRHVA